MKLLIAANLFLLSISGFAQNLHDGKVTGVVEICTKDIAIILDLETQETYKTATYGRDLLYVSEIVELEMMGVDKAKVRGPYFNANIIAFKNVQQGNSGNNGNVQSYSGDMYKYIGEQHNAGLDFVYNKLVIDKANGVFF